MMINLHLVLFHLLCTSLPSLCLLHDAVAKKPFVVYRDTRQRPEDFSEAVRFPPVPQVCRVTRMLFFRPIRKACFHNEMTWSSCDFQLLKAVFISVVKVLVSKEL